MDRRASTALLAGACLLFGSLTGSPAIAKSVKDTDDPKPVCDINPDGDKSGKKSKDDSDGYRFLADKVCVNISGDIQATGQAATATGAVGVSGQAATAAAAAGVPIFGGISGSQRALTLKPDPRIETALPTQYGALKTAFELDWTYNSATGPEQTPTLKEMSLAYVGLTVGFADSLMNFWDGTDFQFSATAPDRSSYLVSYEWKLSDKLKLAFGIEAGSPTSRGATSWQLPNSPPYYTARLRYDKDDWTLHASGAVHELDVRTPPLLTGPLERRTGWAASIGATVPFKFVADDDAFSTQLTYAVDSTIFLGTAADVSFLAATLPTSGPVQGWSAVASYAHNWNDDWTSNVFASRIDLKVDLAIATPSLRTQRLGANLVYQIDKHWQVGIEFDYIEAKIDANGVFGLINGASLSGQVGYLWLQWKL